jgi:tRNA (cmo5U34)-methyltransferase
MQVDKEKFYIEENKRIREELGIDHRLYHIDIPLSIETEINLLEQAGFKNVYIHKQWDNTSIFVCHKGI